MSKYFIMNKALKIDSKYTINMLKGKNTKISRISPKTFLKDNVYEDTNDLVKKKNKKKIKSQDFEIPDYCEYKKIVQVNYNISQLKTISRRYKQKVTGNKPQLIYNVFNYLKYSFYAIKIQKIIRGNILRKFINLLGPAIFNKKCVNDTDFLTLKPLSTIPYYQFYSFKDKDNFIYGFDICSIYNMICENSYANNPYNRRKLPPCISKNIKTIVKLSKKLNIPLNIKIKDDTKNLSYKKKTELRAIHVFQKFDNMGFITDSKWIMGLNRAKCVRYLRELEDVWNYRAQISNDVKQSIIPPNGKLFNNINLYQLFNTKTELFLKNVILDIIEKLTTMSQNQESRSLGGFYALGTITIVSVNAANALPWLYESFLTQQ
jgi:hypothetical protein